ncbi:hypothetical protein [Providencia phage PSTNGR1]|uniref:Uncharacterized protein n=1 Tax=Providencia phage PSTNGR1 TaxID=2783542 RepID=A0A873WFK6_9CAUD|nr:hypothetical protein [Providencia phage PSTNGR1]
MAKFDIQAAIAEAAAKGPDMTQAQTGGGGYTPPEAGVCLATLIGYIEIGNHTTPASNKYPEKKSDKVQLIFELSGGKNAPREDEKGNKFPHRITVTENLSLNEKANFFKLFKKLNYNGEAKHCSQLLGKHWLVTVVHDVKGEGDSKKVYANLRNEDGWTFRPPQRIEGDELAGDVKIIPIKAPEVLSELRLFLWDFPSKEMWESLYIEGEYEERKDEKTGKVISPAKSKNVIQNKIKSANNWVGSPMHELLAGGDAELDLGEGLVEDKVEEAKTAADADPLAGI